MYPYSYSSARYLAGPGAQTIPLPSGCLQSRLTEVNTYRAGNRPQGKRKMGLGKGEDVILERSELRTPLLHGSSATAFLGLEGTKQRMYPLGIGPLSDVIMAKKGIGIHVCSHV